MKIENATHPIGTEWKEAEWKLFLTYADQSKKTSGLIRNILEKEAIGRIDKDDGVAYVYVKSDMLRAMLKSPGTAKNIEDELSDFCEKTMRLVVLDDENTTGKNDGIRIELETITPKIAEEYLKKNIKNRTTREWYVDSLARDMKSGNFHTTHQGIAFDENGDLADGQHRLKAIVKSGVSVNMYVARGVNKEDVERIDNGIKRRFADGIAIKGEYRDNPVFRSAAVASAVRQLVTLGYGTKTVLTDSEIKNFFSHLNEHLKGLYAASITRGGGPGAVNAAALSALICGESPEDIRDFFSIFISGNASGVQNKNVSAPYNLDRMMKEAKIKKVTIPRSKLYKTAQNAIWLFCRGTQTAFIRAPKNDRYPVYDVVDKILNGENGRA